MLVVDAPLLAKSFSLLMICFVALLVSIFFDVGVGLIIRPLWKCPLKPLVAGEGCTRCEPITYVFNTIYSAAGPGSYRFADWSLASGICDGDESSLATN